jgi:hypothetical protein
MFATIALTNYSNLPDLISVSTRIDHHILSQKYDSNCISRINWLDLARTPCFVFEPESLNAFDSIEAVLAVTFEEEPLETYFWEQLTVPSSWNICWTDAAREGGGLAINDPVSGPHWTWYTGAHSWFPCDPEERCDCE